MFCQVYAAGLCTKHQLLLASALRAQGSLRISLDPPGPISTSR